MSEAGRVRPVFRAGAFGWGAFVVALTLAVRLVPAWTLHAEVGDLPTYRTMANTVLRGDNVYAPRVFFPYTPFSQFLPAACLSLSRATGWPFDFAIKLPAIGSDAAAALALFLFLLRRSGLRSSLAWSLFWALNPASILITAFHGNVMAVVPALTLGALLLAEATEEKGERGLLLDLSALLLGMAIAFRSFPILFVPAFLCLLSRSVREAVRFSLLSLLATAASSLPYLVHARETFLREVLAYGGNTDFGWEAAVRAVPLFFDEYKLLEFDLVLLGRTKLLFLAAFGVSVLLLPFFRRASLGRALVVVPLLFYGLYGGVGAQYLVWVLPVAIAMKDRRAIPFTLLSTMALVTFYVIYHPAILFGHFAPLFSEGRAVAGIYLASNLALALLSLGWAFGLVRGELAARHSGEETALASWPPGLRSFLEGPGYRALLALAFAVVLFLLVFALLRAAALLAVVTRA